MRFYRTICMDAGDLYINNKVHSCVWAPCVLKCANGRDVLLLGDKSMLALLHRGVGCAEVLLLIIV